VIRIVFSISKLLKELIKPRRLAIRAQSSQRKFMFMKTSSLCILSENIQCAQSLRQKIKTLSGPKGPQFEGVKMENKQVFKIFGKLFFLIFTSIGALCGIISVIQFNSYTSDKNRMDRMERKINESHKNSARALLHVTEVRNRLLWPAMATKAELEAVCK
jgi:hypothetical protein